MVFVGHAIAADRGSSYVVLGMMSLQIWQVFTAKRVLVVLEGKGSSSALQYLIPQIGTILFQERRTIISRIPGIHFFEWIT